MSCRFSLCTVGRGVLIDIAAHLQVPALGRAETFDRLDLLDAATAKGVRIEPRSILLIRTWWHPAVRPATS